MKQDFIETQVVKINNTLEPNVWDNENLINEDVREVLLENAKFFIEFLKLDSKTKVKDVTLTGSLANYNWTKHSDLDVHIVIDFNQFIDNHELLKEYFNTKKGYWKERYDINVKGYDVEVYVQDFNEEHHSTGVYSLLRDKWITRPQKRYIKIDNNDVEQKASFYKKIIDDLNVNDPYLLKKIEAIKNNLKKLRNVGLMNTGEFSVENLAFKLLRHDGYLEKLVKLAKKHKENLLSLESIDLV